MSEARAKELIYQICLGMQYLKSYGIIHRDLKLENIMMSDATPKSTPKIVDFGLALILGSSETTNDDFGTPGYIAPEVLLK
jgi:serine/threonine protein kinase